MTQPDPKPVRKSDLPTIPSPEWEFHTWFPHPDGGGDMVPGERQRGVLVRRRISYSDWEPVRPDRWADEPPTDAAPAVSAGVSPATDQTAPACSGPIECSHEAALGEAQQQARRLGLMVDEYGAGASALTDKLKRVRDIARRLAAHAVGFQDVLDDSDRDPWARTVGADITALVEALDAPAAAVLPASVDRAVVLREAADHLARQADELWVPGTKAHTVMHADADELRRVAAETPGEAKPWLSDSARIGRTLIWSWTDVGKGAFGEGYRAAQVEARALLGGQRNADVTPSAGGAPQPKARP
jgi:hypothetical protein